MPATGTLLATATCAAAAAAAACYFYRRRRASTIAPRVLVASTSQAKLKAVKAALGAREVTSLPAPSLVEDQPIGTDRTMKGVSNRLKSITAAAAEGYDYAVAIESGLVRLQCAPPRHHATKPPCHQATTPHTHTHAHTHTPRTRPKPKSVRHRLPSPPAVTVYRPRAPQLERDGRPSGAMARNRGCRRAQPAHRCLVGGEQPRARVPVELRWRMGRGRPGA
jgi:hypothetical protein